MTCFARFLEHRTIGKSWRRTFLEAVQRGGDYLVTARVVGFVDW